MLSSQRFLQSMFKVFRTKNFTLTLSVIDSELAKFKTLGNQEIFDTVNDTKVKTKDWWPKKHHRWGEKTLESTNNYSITGSRKSFDSDLDNISLFSWLSTLLYTKRTISCQLNPNFYLTMAIANAKKIATSSVSKSTNSQHNNRTCEFKNLSIVKAWANSAQSYAHLIFFWFSKWLYQAKI